jgi:hypothetical protein
LKPFQDNGRIEATGVGKNNFFRCGHEAFPFADIVCAIIGFLSQEQGLRTPKLFVSVENIYV